MGGTPGVSLRRIACLRVATDQFFRRPRRFVLANPRICLYCTAYQMECGRSSGVEHNLAKVRVESSNLFARSSLAMTFIYLWTTDYGRLVWLAVLALSVGIFALHPLFAEFVQAAVEGARLV